MDTKLFSFFVLDNNYIKTREGKRISSEIDA